MEPSKSGPVGRAVSGVQRARIQALRGGPVGRDGVRTLVVPFM
jgi:hypothetical protein